MKKVLSATVSSVLALAALAAPVAAHAGSVDGKWQIKVLGTAVLPDGKIKSVLGVNVGTTLGSTVATVANPQTVVSDNGVPTLAIEYFATPNISIETICCVTKHHVNGVDALAGANLVNDVYLVPATVTVKYHVQLGPIKPYVGVGPSLFLQLHSKPGVTATALGVTRTKLSSDVGVAFQAGCDIPLGKSGFGLTLDAKKYLMTTNAHFYQGSTEALVTHHTLNPLLLSAGVSYRF
jgi:outer membrane protein